MPDGPVSMSNFSTSGQRTSGLKGRTVIGLIAGISALFAITILGLFLWWRRRLQNVYKRISVIEESADPFSDENSSSPMIGTLRQGYAQAEQLSLADLPPGCMLTSLHAFTYLMEICIFLAQNRARSGKETPKYMDPFGDESAAGSYPISAYLGSSNSEREVGRLPTNQAKPIATFTNHALPARPLPQIRTETETRNEKEVAAEEKAESSRKNRPPVSPSRRDVPEKKVKGRDPVQSLYSLYAKPSMYDKPKSNDSTIPEVPSRDMKTVNETEDPIQSVYAFYSMPRVKEEMTPKEINDKRDALQSVYSLYGASRPSLAAPLLTDTQLHIGAAATFTSDSLTPSLSPIDTNPRRSREDQVNENTASIILSNPFANPRPESNFLSEYATTPSDVSWRNSEYPWELPPWPPQNESTTFAGTSQIRVAPPLRSMAGSQLELKTTGEGSWQTTQRKSRASEIMEELDEAIQNVSL